MPAEIGDEVVDEGLVPVGREEFSRGAGELPAVERVDRGVDGGAVLPGVNLADVVQGLHARVHREVAVIVRGAVSLKYCINA